MQQSIRFCISASRSSTRDSDAAVLYERSTRTSTSTTRPSGLRRFFIGPGDWTLSGNCAERLGDVRTRTGGCRAPLLRRLSERLFELLRKL